MSIPPEKSSSVNRYSIGLCICTMNRPDELDQCLKSVFQGTERPDEVIVSDDSSDHPPVQAVVSRYSGVIYQPGPRQGLSANRNACIRRATSNHIIFIDDDVCVPSEFFTVVRNLITASEPKTVITGYEMNHSKEGSWQGAGQKIVPHNADFWGLQRVPVNHEYRSIVINSTIFPRTLFERALFDEHLRYGSEEIDMARHAVSLGYRIVYQDTLYVHHYPSSINREQYKQFVYASRLYATTKAYLQYERSFIKTFAYLLLAPLQLLGSTVCKGDLSTSWRAVQAIVTACRYFFTSASSSP